ncbi:peptidylprolyl isomerase [Pikeienuella sp. HZG-20]|uniref:peptidylprolyl isomerase n=1 Tax=Paludibacillus litoralis TaxID=3133267 RepID=UPI0030ED95C6
MTMLSTIRRTAAGVLAALLFAAVAAAQTAFAPAVVVNDDVITYYDVEQRAKLLQLNGAPPGPELNNAALDQLIDDRLRAQAGARFKQTADPEEMNAAVAEFAQRAGVDPATFLAKIKQAGIDRAALDTLLSSQIVWRELVNGRFGSRATPSEVELDQEIALAASSQTRSYRISEIALPAGRGQEAEARATIERILAELRRGTDFAKLARRFSRTPSAKNGGDVGWVPETMLPPELAQIIAQTPPGGVTPPFATPGGVSIYRVADSRDETPPWARESQVSLRRISVPIAGDAAAAETKAAALKAETDGCASLPDLAGEATVESIDRTPLNALPAPVRDAVQLLQTGQTSGPVRAENSVDIYVVCERVGGVDEQTRAQLRDQIRSRRLNRLADGYLQELRREAVIERR